MTEAATSLQGDVTEVDAIVIGGGFAGLYSVHKLRNELGLTVQAFDNAGGVGGTWWWNRYPGARSDTEVHAYCYFFDKELYSSWKWTERYPRQEEILDYLEFVSNRYDLNRSYQFKTQVESAVWDEDSSRWLITTDRGQRYFAQFFVEAVGLLSAVKIPEFPGQSSFEGQIYHTARWPHEGVDLEGKRVGVIGTGSSGIQVISEIAAHTDHLYVFQRTPQWVVPSKHRPIDPALLERINADLEGYRHEILHTNTVFGFEESQIPAEGYPAEERAKKFEEVYDDGGGFQYMFKAFSDVIVSREANKAATDVIEKKIRSTVKDPAVADLLVPQEYYAKRPLCCDGYYETYNRANVSLVDVKSDPIVEITPKGIRTEGNEYELDVIILATGFDAVSGNQLKIHHQGRNGVTLQEAWDERPRTFLGLMAHGFPNLFMIYGPMGPFTNQPPAHEAQVDWVGQTIDFVRKSGAGSIEPTKEAEQAWMNECDEIANQTLFAEVNSWINGSNIEGKPVVNYFYMAGMGAYMGRMEHEVATNYSENFDVRGAGVPA